MSEEELYYAGRSKLVDGMVELIKIPGFDIEETDPQEHKNL